MSRIEKMTAKQECQLSAYRDLWLTHGRSTAPANRQLAEAAIGKMYTWLAHELPYFWWCDGPAVGSLLRTLLQANLWTNLGNNLGDNLGANLGANLQANLGWLFWGQHEAYWPAWLAFPHYHLRAMHNNDQLEKLQAWLDISVSCGWWQPYIGIAFVCERPAVQMVDLQGRLHREDGPALLCRDGFTVFAWHGVRVPDDIIEQPGTITVQRIETEKNVEIRRIMIERYGQAKFLTDSGTKPIHQDDWGTLYRKEVPDDEPLVMVKVVNSTPEPDGSFRDYFIRVPPQMERASQAVAWTFGRTEKEYAPKRQT